MLHTAVQILRGCYFNNMYSRYQSVVTEQSSIQDISLSALNSHLFKISVCCRWTVIYSRYQSVVTEQSSIQDISLLSLNSHLFKISVCCHWTVIYSRYQSVVTEQSSIQDISLVVTGQSSIQHYWLRVCDTEDLSTPVASLSPARLPGKGNKVVNISLKWCIAW